MSKKTCKVKITSAVAFGGEIKRPGTIMDLPEDQAKNLLERGRAELYTAGDKAEGGDSGDGDDTDPSLDEMSDDELRLEAIDYEIDGAEDMSREDLIAAIEAAEASNAE